MKKLILACSLMMSFQAHASMTCADAFFVTPSGPESRLFVGKEISRIGLADQAYVTRWMTKTKEAQGPWDKKGETLIVGINTWTQMAEWMEAIGRHSIGLATLHLPGDSNGTAALRVGSKYYSFNQAAGRERRLFDNLHSSHSLTEATFMVTPEEMDAIDEFMRARHNRKIRAKTSVRNGPEEGQAIAPKFNPTGFTLSVESCAAACTAWMDPKWLAHYDKPEVLRNLAERLALEPTFVARRNVWSNSRNPNVAAITLLGIQADPARVESMIENNRWGTLRGLPRWGLIPDSPSGETATYKAKRIPLSKWLAGKQQN